MWSWHVQHTCSQLHNELLHIPSAVTALHIIIETHLRKWLAHHFYDFLDYQKCYMTVERVSRWAKEETGGSCCWLVSDAFERGISGPAWESRWMDTTRSSPWLQSPIVDVFWTKRGLANLISKVWSEFWACRMTTNCGDCCDAGSTDHDDGSATWGDQSWQGHLCSAIVENWGYGLQHRVLHCEGAGAKTWRLLRAEYVGTSGRRLATVVREVVCPREQWSAHAALEKVFLTSHIEQKIKLPPQSWCSQCTNERGVKDRHKRVMMERAESVLSVIAFDCCFIKFSGRESGTAVDAGVTCHWIHDGGADEDDGSKDSLKNCFDDESNPDVMAILRQWRLPENWRRFPRHDSQTNPAERAIRTLEEQVEIQCDVKTLMTARTTLNWFHVVWDSTVPNSISTLPMHESEQNHSQTWQRLGQRERLDEDNVHVITISSEGQAARTIHRLPPSQLTDISLLRDARGWPWDAQGDVRRGRRPNVPRAEVTMPEVSGAVRADEPHHWKRR